MELPREPIMNQKQEITIIQDHKILGSTQVFSHYHYFSSCLLIHLTQKTCKFVYFIETEPEFIDLLFGFVEMHAKGCNTGASVSPIAQDVGCTAGNWQRICSEANPTRVALQKIEEKKKY